jgi:Sec-independent protein translocase protein TatA
VSHHQKSQRYYYQGAADMVLGLSWGQLALVLGASVALFGPKDIVLIGRAAGKLTGKAVGYIQTARGQFDPILQRSEINTVHKELQETMAQLEAIRHEMRTGLSILNPGPMTRQVMDSAAPGLLNPVEIKETGDCAVA